MTTTEINQAIAARIFLALWERSICADMQYGFWLEREMGRV